MTTSSDISQIHLLRTSRHGKCIEGDKHLNKKCVTGGDKFLASYMQK